MEPSILERIFTPRSLGQKTGDKILMPKLKFLRIHKGLVSSAAMNKEELNIAPSDNMDV